MQDSTKILHNIPVDELTGAISVPIYQTATYVQEAPGVNKGFDYSRTNNPTRKVLEELIAKLENGKTGVAFGSGIAAIDAVLRLLKPGDEILAIDDIYGGAFRLFTQIYKKYGIKVNYIDTSNVEHVVNAISSNTKFIWLETPSNPTLKVSDIQKIAQIAKHYNSLVVVDNTFASPVIQRPLDLGADIIIHSATKYLAGHSDVIAGLVVTREEELGAKIKFLQNATGAVPGPFDCWLSIRGIQTLELRLERQCKNAALITDFLTSSKYIDKVYYPGLSSHKNHHIAAQQQKLFGAMVSFSLKDDNAFSAIKLAQSTTFFKLAESLGGVKSLICHPFSMTHKTIPAEIKRTTGIQDSLIRLSCGIESAEDLVKDLEQALESIHQKKYAVSFADV